MAKGWFDPLLVPGAWFDPLVEPEAWFDELLIDDAGGAALTLLDDLSGYWAFDESSGVALDKLGFNDLTDNNTVGSAPGKVGDARDFEADNAEYFSHADNEDLSTGDVDWTMQFWVKPETLVNFPVIANKGWASGTPEWVLYYDTNTLNLIFHVQGASGGLAGGSISAGVWTHIVIYHDSVNDELGLVVNNGTPSTLAHSAGVPDTATDFVIGASVLQALYWDGLIDDVGFWKGRVLSADDRADLYNGGNGHPYERFGGTPADFVFSVDPGSYALTGAAAALRVGRKVAAVAGSYAVTGTVASLERGLRLVADGGSYAVTGTDATLRKGYPLAATAGSYAVTGTAATLRVTRRISAAAGSYAVTGTAASLERGYRLSAAGGAYVVTGAAADLDYSGAGYKLIAEAGTFSVTGAAANLLVRRRLSADFGAYAVTGTPAVLRTARVLAADVGAYSLTGAAAVLRAGRRVLAEPGAFSVTGGAAGLLAGRVLAAASGAYVVTGADADFDYHILSGGYLYVAAGGHTYAIGTSV